MLAPYSWLKDYVEIDIKPKELADKMTMSGTKVEKIEYLGKEINKVVVGKILEINKHPNADRLLVTKVDIGKEVIQIVTGAKNINEGDYIPVALVGSTLPGGLEIKKSKLRGVESYGMMCSAEELKLDINNLPKEQIEGIYIFPERLPIGKDVKEVFGLNEAIFEFELTNNRPDCMSIVGLAREVAGTLNKPLNMPNIDIKVKKGSIEKYTSVKILDNDHCFRFTAAIIKDVKIGESPKWMQERLAKVGVRAINNIVDVTNYVMMELGQPLHAYDYNKLIENRIVVRKALPGEELTTLDGIKRSLDPSMLVIADAKKPLGIAGIMGGANSEVDENTCTILLEAANFEKDNLRQTAKKIGLRTEASTRYEKGIDPNLTMLAITRACKLLEEINAGTIVDGFMDVYPNPLNAHYVNVDPEWVNKFIGINISSKEMANYLESLGMEVAINNVLKIKVPTFRQDLKIPEDIVEEVARLYGYDKIPSTLMSGVTVLGTKTYKQKLEERVKNLLVSQGGYEICTYSFVSPQSLDKLNIPEDSKKREVLRLINPLGEENSIMRTTMISSMLEVISHNISHNIDEAFLFEIANTYHPTKSNIEKFPIENKYLCLGLYGNVDFFDIKGIVENILNELGISKYEFQRLNSLSFHPGRSAQVLYEGKILGVLGEIHPNVAENYGISKRIYIGEFNFDLLNQNSKLDKKYKTLPKYPSVVRDIAIQIKDNIPVREVEKIIENQKSPIIESYSLFDIYKGEQIPEGYKSVAYSIVYRNNNRTLTDREVDIIQNKIVLDLQSKIEASLRE
ncbi:MAG TPA: phenylalanine--tRNA ligase subunit beta [Eubacteriaceae bacterium]|nr:phenylalanine--tRNA ligase subunit beta [Eubacteriaceae bacterium]